MTDIITNPNKRCSQCEGREVLYVEADQVVDTNLMEVDFQIHICKNKVECEQNQQAENTVVTFETDGEQITGIKTDEFEVRKE